MKVRIPVALLTSLLAACGGSSATSNEDLIGGRLTREGEFPGTLLIRGNCTATRVGPDLILTAAHCVGPVLSVGGSIAVTNDSLTEKPFEGTGDTFSANTVLRVTATELNVREQASRSATILDRLYQGERVVVALDYSDSSGWVFVKTSRGTWGYVSRQYVIPESVIPQGNWRYVNVRQIDIAPSWAAACTEGVDCSSVVFGARHPASDVAVVKVEGDLGNIPIIPVDLSPIQEGESVVVTGYGCDQAVGSTYDYTFAHLKVSKTKSLPFDAAIHESSFMQESDRASGLLAQQGALYSLTPGPDFPALGDPADDAAGGLCPGDSGGPLYRVSKEGQSVVGINANYTFINGYALYSDGISFEYGGTPYTNWHTRLDSKANGVGSWLKTLGVATICSQNNCE